MNYICGVLIDCWAHAWNNCSQIVVRQSIAISCDQSSNQSCDQKILKWILLCAALDAPDGWTLNSLIGMHMKELFYDRLVRMLFTHTHTDFAQNRLTPADKFNHKSKKNILYQRSNISALIIKPNCSSLLQYQRHLVSHLLPFNRWHCSLSHLKVAKIIWLDALMEKKNKIFNQNSERFGWKCSKKLWIK